jgi:hypothetical protein
MGAARMPFNPSSAMKEPSSNINLLKASLLYRELQAEHEEILRHKWFESEKAGHDIGFDFAQVDWRIKHGRQWRKERQERNVPLSFEI